MKKVYTFLALAAFAGVSVAGARNVANIQVAVSDFNQDQQVTERTVKFKSDRKNLKAISSVNDVLGDYDWSYFSLIDDGTEGEHIGSLTIEATTDPTKVTITGLCPQFSQTGVPVVEATIDLAAGTLSIPYQELGMYGPDSSGISGVVVCDATRLTVDPETYKITNIEPIDAFVGHFAEDGTIEFDPFDCIRFGFDYDSGQGMKWGGFVYAYGNVFEKQSDTLDHTGWISCGKAKFTDGWVVTAFTEDPYTWDVEVEKLAENPSILRLVNPYKVGNGMPQGLEQYNYSTQEGCIMFDIAEPKAVPVQPGIYSGMKLEDNPGKMFCSNLVGYYVYVEEFSVEDLVDSLEPEEMSVLEGNTLTVRACCFGIGSRPFATYTWQTEDGEEVEMTSIIVLPDAALSAVTDIEMSDANAPVEYYNMQGVKIANPEKGAFVIAKQGSRVEKKVVR